MHDVSPHTVADLRPEGLAATTADLRPLLDQLTLAEKVALLTGADMWSTVGNERIGLRPMVLSDGPSGVRGSSFDERDPSLNLPSASALASSWDRSLARRYGAALAVEARRKGVDVVLGPTINLHRSPLGGRHFECLSEDPVLTADLAASYVDGIQGNGVAAALKHYVANDSETDRFTVDVQVSDRALRELYLLAFEKAVAEAGSWLVMSAYNGINGATATENELLETPLNSEWGFDGVVVSDWTAVRTLESARASQDLAMPGPSGPWGDALVDAVRAGGIDESVIDRKVLRILRLAERVGALGDTVPTVPTTVEDGTRLAREAAAAGTVLLENREVDGRRELPWEASSLRTVAVIGHNAVQARTQGGGSATVFPAYTVSPLAGLRSALPEADVRWSLGAVVREDLDPFTADQVINPVTGDPGLHVRFMDGDGRELYTEDRLSSHLIYFGGAAPLGETRLLEVTTTYTPEQTGQAELGFALVGNARLWADDRLVLEKRLDMVGDDIAAALLSPPTASAVVELTAGVPVAVRFECDLTGFPAMALKLGSKPAEADPSDVIADAVAVAAAADVAVVVVGTNSTVESEGHDRSTLALPGHQDDLVRAVAAVNPHTVVVVNAGAPVLMPWRDEVAAVAVGYFGGQEFGDAVADVLLGLVEPGGRLPTTWPAADVDAPVLSTQPTDGALVYSEGIHVGYRAWLRHDPSPAYWFGHGLGYADISLTDVSGATHLEPGDTLTVSVQLHNTSDREGKQVVQVYAERPDSAVERPVRWLVGFASTRVAAGLGTTVEIEVPARSLAHWDDGWVHETGDFVLRVGTSAADLPHAVTVTMGGRA